MRSTILRSFLILSIASALGGCKQYYAVDDACVDKLSSDKGLPPVSVAAFKRINCYRRLTGVIRIPGNETVQKAADGEIAYMQQNPDWNQLNGSAGPVFWLTQTFEAPGFTGTNIYERLTEPEDRGGAGYVFYDIGGTSIWEFIWVILADDPTELPSGADAIDELMRFPVFRQSALQPSWIDGAYAEGELNQQWFVDGSYFGPGDTAPNAALAPYGRVYYMVTMYSAPHFEHAATPVLLPRDEQTDVPLYSWSQNRNVVLSDGRFAPTQLSYPVTLLMGAIDPANYAPVDQNQYQALISHASIVGPEGPLETEVVHPGDDAEDSWPSGAYLRTTLAIFARHPFTPSTNYTVYADYTTPEGQFQMEYSFHTRNDDPGVDPVLGLTAATTAVGGTVTRERHFPMFQPSAVEYPAGTFTQQAAATSGVSQKP